MASSAARAVPPTRDRIARLLMALNAALALAAGALGAGTALAAPEGQMIVEWWRALGFLVFAALTGAVGAGEVIAVDGYLAVSTLGAYVVCRGWLGWTSPTGAGRPIAWGRADTA